MPIQMLPPVKREQGWGEILGTGLGQGLSALMQHKVSQIQAEKKAKAWESMGIDPEQARFIVGQPEWLQKELIGRLEGFGGQQQQGQQAQGYGIPSEQQAMASQPGGMTIGKSAAQKKEDYERFKETKVFRHSLIEARKSAKNDIRDLSRLEELSESGKLDTPGYVAMLKGLGLDIPSLMSAESQEFQKIQQSFLKSAKQYFGSRISNYEVEQFLKTLPSMSQSPEGRRRVIANLKQLARGADERYKAYEEVLRENKGIPPLDIEEQVERNSEKRLDRIADQFKRDLAKPVPKGQSKIITALQATAGNIAKPLAGAAAGAALGSVVPVVGTAAGAIGGAGLGGLSGLMGFFK